MRHVASNTIVGLMAVGILAGLSTEASAVTARHVYNKGHGYGRHHYYGGRSNVGPAVAGAALGIIGLAAGAAAANAYNRDGYDYGYEPGYAYGGYGQAPYTYGGYGYGYQPY